MTVSPDPIGRARRRRGGRGRWSGVLRWLGVAAGAIVVFAGGVALGQALEERPKAGQPVTTYATIQPWTRTGAVTRTSTITVTEE